MNNFGPPNPYSAATGIGATRYGHPRGGGGSGGRRGGGRGGAQQFYQNHGGAAGAGPPMNGVLPQQPQHPITQTLQQLRSASWDFPLDCPTARTAEIGDKDFLAKLTFGNVFGVCIHDVKPIACICGRSKAFCCSKCKSFFCSDNCSRLLSMEQRQALAELHASMGLPPTGANPMQGPGLGLGGPRFRVSSDSNAAAAVVEEPAGADAEEPSQPTPGPPNESESESDQKQERASETGTADDLADLVNIISELSTTASANGPALEVMEVEAQSGPAAAPTQPTVTVTLEPGPSTGFGVDFSIGLGNLGRGRGRGRGRTEGSDSGSGSVVGLPPPAPPATRPEPFMIGETIEVVVRWTLDPADCHVSPISISEKNREIEDLINSVQPEDWEPLQDPQPESPCLAYFYDGEDVALYRAKVVESNPFSDMCTIKYVDYGNCVRADKSELKAMPAALRQIPALATHVLFKEICPPRVEPEWSEEATQHFKELVEGKVCRFTPTEDAGGFYFGLLTLLNSAGGQQQRTTENGIGSAGAGGEEDVCERMVRDGYAEEMPMGGRF